jgi:hypothetical protein
MSLKFAQGPYTPKNPDKYIGAKVPYCRSSWETTFCMFCDNNPAVESWASEPIKIPYRDPLTGKQTVYVPDFLIKYIDKNQKSHVEMIEIKPANQMILERVGKNPYNQAQYVKNMAKWSAATDYCKNRGIKFRVINESDIFVNTGNKKR